MVALAPKSMVTHSSLHPRLRHALTKCSAGKMPLVRWPFFIIFSSVMVQWAAAGTMISSFRCWYGFPFRWKLWLMLRVGSRSLPLFGQRVPRPFICGDP